jgi:hypothetical protein
MACTANEGKEGRYWWRKSEREGPLERPSPRWVDNIEMDLEEIGWDHMDWIGLDQDGKNRKDFVNAVINLSVP